MNWIGYVNENLYFSRLQIDMAEDEAGNLPRRRAAEKASLLFLHRAYIGFLNELAVKRRIKEYVVSLVELENHIGFESAEITQLKLQAQDRDSWLSSLLRQYAAAIKPAAANDGPQGHATSDGAGLIASSENQPEMLAEQMMLEMKACIQALRESSTEW